MSERTSLKIEATVMECTLVDDEPSQDTRFACVPNKLTSKMLLALTVSGF